MVEDAPAANGPHIGHIESLNMRFIPGVKPGSHRFPFDWVAGTPGTREVEIEGDDGVRRRFHRLNGTPLNDANFDLEVNFPEYCETPPGGKARTFPRATGILIGRDNPMGLMRAGRARWRIENETFNTLKNRGYAFGRNFGHSCRHLCQRKAEMSPRGCGFG